MKQTEANEKKTYYFDYKGQLNEEYRTAFDKIEKYCQMQLVDSVECNESMNYLMDVFLNAQKDGVSVQKITGGSIENFCKCFLSDVSAKGRVRAFFERSRSIAWIFLVLSVFFYVLPAVMGSQDVWKTLGKESDLFYGMVLGLLLSILLDCVIHAIVRQIIFKAKKYRMAYGIAANLSVYAVGIASLWLIPDFAIEVPDIPLGAVPLMLMVWLMVSRLVMGFINVSDGKAFFDKGERMGENQVSFRSGVLRGMVDEFRKDFEKTNARRVKKGKMPLTREEFLEKQRKDTKKARVSMWCALLVTGAVYIGMIVGVVMDSEPLDAAIFTAILAVTYAVLMYPLCVWPTRMRERFQKIMDESGKTFFDDDIYEEFK